MESQHSMDTTMDSVFELDISSPMDTFASLTVLVVLVMGGPTSPAADVAPLIVDSLLPQANALVSRIVPSFDSFLSLKLNDIMIAVLFFQLNLNGK